MPCNICLKEGGGYYHYQPTKENSVTTQMPQPVVICDSCSRTYFNQPFASLEVCLEFSRDPKAYKQKPKL